MGPPSAWYHRGSSSIAVSALLIFAQLAWPLTAVAEKIHGKLAEPITRGQFIFSAGNSFHWHVAEQLRPMARSAGIRDQKTDGQPIGYSRVLTQWEVPDERNKAKQSLRAGKVDVLTLSPIYLPDEGIENFAKLALEHNPNIRITIQESWLAFDRYDPSDPKFRNRPKTLDHNAITGDELRKRHAPYFQIVSETVREVNKKQGKQVVSVVPSGHAAITLREKIIAGEAPGLKTQEDLFFDALGHTRPPLAILNTYCHFAVIYRRSPVGLAVPTILKSNDNDDSDAKLNRLLQEVAWEAVIQHPLSGVRAMNP